MIILYLFGRILHWNFLGLDISFYGSFLIMNFIYFIDIGIIRLYILSWLVLAICGLQKICPFLLSVEFGGIKLFIVFFYFHFNTFMISSIMSYLIPDIWFISFILSVLIEFYHFYKFSKKKFISLIFSIVSYFHFHCFLLWSLLFHSFFLFWVYFDLLFLGSWEKNLGYLFDTFLC